ncbi:hypothetical protein ASPWEDRAFT_169472 [Aspergillus wentii DTO 134E9]|uniref:Uncharacterized protein n=1 Tax=Aspergillus wentii DTO 134E9 TaxID=1073089 RepID=A0A1L9RXG7_ASPWE|nr:uncharacterized protein ASPWEDRAFT_169472 [Aspergillus wentii DTO 134E9]OJJ39640.1 hypothetical protein ASPWEDRAFT_169472 [Aspergillus wentii DTO 134E9]
MDAQAEDIDQQASEFNNAAAFCAYTIRQISQSQSTATPQILIFTEISSEWVDEIVKTLQDGDLKTSFSYNSSTKVFQLRTMTTAIECSDQKWCYSALAKWVTSGLITIDEHFQLAGLGNTLIEFTSGPYVGSKKVAHFMIQQPGALMPPLVFESGREPLRRLRDDMNLWIVGGAGDVHAVIITKWSQVAGTNQVNGFVESYTLGRDGTPRFGQREQVFPIPAGTLPGTQKIRLTRRMVFGRRPSPGQNPRDVFELDVDILRIHASGNLSRMGLRPA